MLDYSAYKPGNRSYFEVRFGVAVSEWTQVAFALTTGLAAAVIGCIFL